LLNSNYSKEQNENNPRNHEIDKIIVNGLLIRYGKKKVIDSIDYTFERGKKYILFGETGVGKSTLARALINQKEIVQGEIKYISKNVEIEFSKVKDKIKVVEQSPWIFNMSILDNIAFYKDIDKRKVEKLLNNLSFSKDFISTRVDEIMGENGQRLSQGEKQRISIARALYSDASFLILDEMNASMDVETALLIEKSILDIPNIGIINICHHANYELLDKYDYRLELKDGKIYDVSS
jgi:ABC-type transport system involved in cytochrome bd biosynthesis fused ATPase/permease subunit